MSDSDDLRITVSVASVRTNGLVLTMRGWCMPPATELTVSLPSGEVIAAEVGLVRDDVAKQLGRLEDRNCGWSLSATVPASATKGISAEVRAVFADGSAHSVPAVVEPFDDDALTRCALMRIADAPISRTQSADRTVPDILEVLRQQTAVPLVEKSIDLKEFEKFRRRADYDTRYASYVKQFKQHLRAKQLEHFLSFQLVSLKQTGIYMDAAASASPFFDIIVRGGYARFCYQQDLNYQPGRVKHRIGSNSRAIPLPGQSLDGVFLHNAWEHFEGMSDFATLIEARRLLRPGGQICIIPLGLLSSMQILTSPASWYTKYKMAPEEPAFDPRCTIILDEAAVQRQIKYFDPENLIKELALVVGIAFEIVFFENYKEAKFSPFALVGTRQD